MSAAAPDPARAPVRPRVRIPGSDLPRLLEEEVAELLAAGAGATVWLVGAAGRGKTTALAHLAAVFGDEPRLRLVDGGPAPAADGAVTVRAITHARRPWSKGDHVFHLLPWQPDDVLDYLLAHHGAHVARVLEAWRRGAPHDLLLAPAVCRAVLDTMVARPDLDVPRTALDAVLRETLGDRHGAAIAHAVRAVRPDREPALLPEVLDGFAHLFDSGTVRGLLVAQWILRVARRQPRSRPVELVWSRETCRGIAHWLDADDGLQAALEQVATRTRLRHKALVFGALAVRQPGYRPPRGLRGNLRWARLVAVDLHGQRVRADLSHADLDGANLVSARLDGSRLAHASLRSASAPYATFDRVQATEVDASALEAPRASFRDAMLARARLHGAQFDAADLTCANLGFADLAQASLRGARLTAARLQGARLDDADLEGADLDRARLDVVDVRRARLQGVSARRAGFLRCNFEGVAIPSLQAAGARFIDCDLTDAAFPAADLRAASFGGCGLAGVDWQGADLRGADLRRVTFHLGNSRSGLVDSTIAGEGSRTGFYTDESLEGRFRAPEDVRKANLRDCDLRGARLDDTDFYLVDLRGAKLDPLQRRWLERCRAILDPRDDRATGS